MTDTHRVTGVVLETTFTEEDADHRLTSIVVEAAHDPDPDHRVTSMVIEPVHDPDPDHRVTQMAIELVWKPSDPIFGYAYII